MDKDGPEVTDTAIVETGSTDCDSNAANIEEEWNFDGPSSMQTSRMLLPVGTLWCMQD